MGTTSYFDGSSAAMTDRAEDRLTSCSPDLPPKITATLIFGIDDVSSIFRQYLDLWLKLDPKTFLHLSLDVSKQRPKVRGRRPSFMKKFACCSDTAIPPHRAPLSPAASMSRPA